jgi:hypothetical protein
MSLKPKGIIHPSHPVANGVFPIQVSPVFPSPIVPIIKDQKSSTPLQHHQAICQAGMRNSSGRNQQHYRLFDEEIFENAYMPMWHLLKLVVIKEEHPLGIGKIRFKKDP